MDINCSSNVEWNDIAVTINCIATAEDILLAHVLVWIIQRNKGERGRETKIDFKEVALSVLVDGKSEIHRAG